MIRSLTNRHMSIRAFSTPKHSGQLNEDSYQCSSKGVFAISDGASISFDSASWSKILVRHYAREPDFSLKWLSGAIAHFAKIYNRESLPWMQQAAFDRGSFASLLGVRIFDKGRFLKVFAVGDSLAVLCDGDEIHDTHPYSGPEQFDQRPQLLSTSPDRNSFLSDIVLQDDLYAHWTFSSLRKPALLCMTDALGQWVLSLRAKRPSPISILRAIAKPREFTKFVERERASGRIKRDDTTLVIYG
jgi:hypothetical protein